MWDPAVEDHCVQALSADGDCDVQAQPCSPTLATQKWQWVSQGDGYANIKLGNQCLHVGPTLVVDVASGNKYNPALVRPCDGSDSQLFKFPVVCLDSLLGSHLVGQPIIFYNCDLTGRNVFNRAQEMTVLPHD
ncbi:hypothetical protein HYH03_013616 [Edaphochlamys debaryana]|uniref:Ricin B lectin domain-containing protein n=1 Tax=Edaphochlamys debaryana TaxID=47281 RepID=A0A835XPQ6_9CHLO|nr:hypothetical protein HYH03_013616 [Edaphochlamys debaryana]|eukprot:KAG2487771.1 hypothetical protein HYH03_013616 [Edaphochlamys debaryana]